MEETPSLRPAGMPVVVTGAIAGAMPFFLSTASTSWSSVNGQVTSFVYRDWIAVGAGAFAIACGIVALVIAGRAKATKVIGLAALVVALGGVQIARGFGVFASPPSTSSGISAIGPTEPFPSPPKVAPTPETCANGDECWDVGEALFEKQPERAAIALIRACDFGIKGGCLNAPVALRDKPDVARDNALYEKACKLGAPKGCANLGVAYLLGEGVEKNLDKGREMLADACVKNDATGCRNMAVIYRDAMGVPADDKEALRYSILACELGNEEEAGACADAAAFLLQGDPPDEKRALRFAQRACELGDRGCNNLGGMTEDGIAGLAKDPAAARVLYEKSCKAGSELGCKNLARVDNAKK